MKGWPKPPCRVGEGKERSPKPVVHEETAITSPVLYTFGNSLPKTCRGNSRTFGSDQIN